MKRNNIITICFTLLVCLMLLGCGMDVKHELDKINSDTEEASVLEKVVSNHNFESCVFFDDEHKMINGPLSQEALKLHARYVEFHFKGDRCYTYKLRNRDNIDYILRGRLFKTY